jgi:hypothetical protein
MPDPRSPETAHHARLYLEVASRHLIDAAAILTDRPQAELGSAAEEAALLIARAQAEATLSIAETIAGGIRLSEQAADAMAGFEEQAELLASAISRLIGKLDDLG